MDEQKRLIIAALAEFLESAKEDEEKGRIKSAITMYFKTTIFHQSRIYGLSGICCAQVSEMLRISEHVRNA